MTLTFKGTSKTLTHLIYGAAALGITKFHYNDAGHVVFQATDEAQADALRVKATRLNVREVTPPVTVQFAQGIQGTVKEKTFADQRAFDVWLEKNAGNVEVLRTAVALREVK